MAQLIELPAQLHAGDTIERTVYLAGYEPGDGWTLKLVITDSAASHEIVASAGGTDNASHVLAITSGELAAGHYRYGLVVAQGGNRLTLQSGRLQLLPNFADGPADHRSHVEKVLAALEAMLEGKASKDQMSLTVEGQSIGRTDPLVLLQWRNQYRAELNTLLRRQKGWRDRPRKLFRL